MRRLLLIVLAGSLMLALAQLPAPGAEPAPWDPDFHPYATGDLVTYEGVTYRCRQAHTSQPGWTPPATPALWEPAGGGTPTTAPPTTAPPPTTSPPTTSPPTTAPPTTSSPPGTVVVRTAQELRDALEAARPGQVIQLADGTYRGPFETTRSGLPGQPVTLRGSRAAVLDNNGSGYGLHLEGDWWVLDGFTIADALKGVMLDGANHNLIDGLSIHGIGHEAVHFRAFSSDNTLRDSLIADTGRANAGFGEGAYLGSARSNWDRHSGGQPDRSDRNRVTGNHFGPGVRAEAVDVKEGTSGGEVSGNTFDGTGMTGANFADSWVDVKGNGYLVAGNHGSGTVLDGFQTHVILDGWGERNAFRDNVAEVNASGYGFRIQLRDGSALGNAVYDDNRVTAAGSGAANVPLTPAG